MALRRLAHLDDDDGLLHDVRDLRGDEVKQYVHASLCRRSKRIGLPHVHRTET